MRIPDGWTYVSDYCLRRDGYTICRIGELYELWEGNKQMHVNLPSPQAAIEAWELLTNVREAMEPGEAA